MFHWICPECGREIAPTVRECPVCDPNAATPEPVQAGVVEAPAQALVSESAGPSTTVVSAPAVVSARSERRRLRDVPTETIELPPGGLQALFEAEQAGKIALPPIAAPVPHVEVIQPSVPEPPKRAKRQDSGRYWLKVSREGNSLLDPLARLEAFARRRAPELETAPVPVPAPVALPAPVLPQVNASEPTVLEAAPIQEEDLDLALPTFGAADLSDDPLDNLVSAMGIEEESAPPQATSFFALSGPNVSIPPAFHALISELAPTEHVDEPVKAAQSNLTRVEAHEPHLNDQLASLDEDLPQLFDFRLSNRDDQVLRSPAHSWAESESNVRPVEPETPPSIPSPQMAEWVPFSPVADHPIYPVPSSYDPRNAGCEPRVTLPGPALIKKLVSFQDKELYPVLRSNQPQQAKKGGVPRWMVTALILGTLLGAGFSSIFTFTPASSSAEAKSTAKAPLTAAEETTSEVKPEAVANVSPSIATPLAKALEVTGFRIQLDANKKAEIDYVIVNHSATKLSGVTVFVTLHSTEAKAGEPPLCRFSFAAPELKPQEAKAMVSTIERFNRPVNVPDWQNIRAEIEIGQ